ncbi:MAG: InlB B-repeat-containing protein [Oscillospiraceae bacterium]|nr:InlB B-repeat-containing protein [Oscillospiraceae bacterium]
MEKRIRKPLSLLLTALLLFGSAAYLMRQAVASTATPYYEWKQYDSQWGGDTIRSKTIKEVGCLATAVAILAVHAELKSESNYDPGTFVKNMKAAGGFESNDNLIWSAVPEVLPGLAVTDYRVTLSGTQAQKIAKIKGYYDQGYYMAIAVKNEGHWVALRYATSSVITMMDPASTATNLFEKYDAAGCTRLALFKAEKPGNAYSVKFNANGGTGAPAGQLKSHGTALKLSATAPARAGWSFLGWGTSATATTAVYQPGGSYTANEKITLHAVWGKGESDSGGNKETTIPDGTNAGEETPPPQSGSAMEQAWNNFLSSLWAMFNFLFPNLMQFLGQTSNI